MHARLFLPRVPVLLSLTSPNFLAFATHCYRKSDIQAIFEYHALYSAPCILHPDVADSGGLKVASRVCSETNHRAGKKEKRKKRSKRLCQCRECNERYCNINNRISADRVAESCRCSYCCCRGTVCDRGMSAS